MGYSCAMREHLGVQERGLCAPSPTFPVVGEGAPAVIRETGYAPAYRKMELSVDGGANRYGARSVAFLLTF